MVIAFDGEECKPNFVLLGVLCLTEEIEIFFLWFDNYSDVPQIFQGPISTGTSKYVGLDFTHTLAATHVFAFPSRKNHATTLRFHWLVSNWTSGVQFRE